ncbi:MAG TPA: hypothetical protein VNL17_05345 [Verrucomicrobiae bacterium]|nr:hypothetical protein [Verrucomicrobiae bacterium]
MMDNTAIAPELPQRSRWLPTIGLTLWLIFMLGLSLSQWRLVMINADGDPSLHWRLGQWMIEHRSVIHADVFSHTRPGRTVVTMEWLTEVAFAAAGDALGWNGIVLLAATFIATSLWMLYRQLLSEGNDLLLSTGLTLLAAMTCSMHWLARPHVISFAFLTFWAWQLRAFEQGRLPPRRLFVLLVPLTALWVNLHAGFLTGLMLIGVYFVGAAAELRDHDIGQRMIARRRMATLALLGASCLVASLVNPNGWRLHAYILDFLQHPKLVSLVNEFRSPDFHSNGTRGFLLMLFVLAFTLITARSRLSRTEILLVGWAGCLALRWVRNMPVFAIVATPILAQHLTLWLRGRCDSVLLTLYRKVCENVSQIDKRADGRWLAGIASVMLLLVVAKPRVVGGEPILATELLTNRFPVAAVRFLQQNPSPVHGEMFNNYGWGGYLMLALPERKIFVDGRNDFYGPELIQDFDTVNRVHPGWEDVLRKYKVDWTVLPRAHPLNELLALRKNWSLSYTDDVTAVYSCRPE